MSEQVMTQAKPQPIQASSSHSILQCCSNGIECEECREKRLGIQRKATLAASSGLLQRKCACGGVPGVDGECEECREKRLSLQRSPPQPAASSQAVPPIVHDVLGSSGQPLDAGTRAFMEPRFGHDFSRVRVHTDAKAAASARAVNALAYTVGRDVVFGQGQYAPGTSIGKRMLAHELTHVVQQRNAIRRSPAQLNVNSPGDADEREADDVAEKIDSGNVSKVKYSITVPRIQRITGDELIRTNRVGDVKGVDAHDAIVQDFTRQLGNDAFPFRSIPNATWAEYRTECGDFPPSRSIRQPRPDPFSPYPNYGHPDLVLSAGKDAELAEIKYAHLACVDEGERQVDHYIRYGNDDEAWKKRQGITELRLMSMSSYTPPTEPLPLPHNQPPITVAWYQNGLLFYKAIEEKKTEVYVCGVKDTEGKLNKLLNSALGGAQRIVSKYIDKSIDPILTKLINTMDVRQAINTVLGTKNDRIAQLIQDKFRDVIDRELRKLVMNLKDRTLTRVRQKLQEQLLTYLKESLDALCAAAVAGTVTVTVNDLLNQFEKDLPKYLFPVFAKFIQESVNDLLADIGKSIKESIERLPLAVKILAAIFLVALVILLLPEELIAAAIAAIGAAIAAIGAALAQWLPQLVEEFAL